MASRPMESPAQARLQGFLAERAPEVAEFARALRQRVCTVFPSAAVPVDDNSVVIGFGPSERPSEAVLSLAVNPRWVNLCFLRAADLRDPQGLLEGSGKTARDVMVRRMEDFDHPGVQKLVLQAGSGAARAGEGARLIIRSVSPIRRPRRRLRLSPPVSRGLWRLMRGTRLQPPVRRGARGWARRRS